MRCLTSAKDLPYTQWYTIDEIPIDRLCIYAGLTFNSSYARLSFHGLFTCFTLSKACHMLFILCLSFHGLFTCFTLSKACHTLLILCLSFHGLFTCFTLSKACHTLLILCLSFPSFFTCFTCFSCCFAHIIALSALYRSLTLCLLCFCCPHGQANLRACSVASHCGHTFLRRIDN